MLLSAEESLLLAAMKQENLASKRPCRFGKRKSFVLSLLLNHQILSVTVLLQKACSRFLKTIPTSLNLFRLMKAIWTSLKVMNLEAQLKLPKAFKKEFLNSLIYRAVLGLPRINFWPKWLLICKNRLGLRSLENVIFHMFFGRYM